MFQLTKVSVLTEKYQDIYEENFINKTRKGESLLVCLARKILFLEIKVCPDMFKPLKKVFKVAFIKYVL